MENQSHPMFDNLSEFRLQAQNPCPAETSESISSIEDDISACHADVASESGITVIYEEILDRYSSSSKTQILSSVKTREATSNEDDDLGRCNHEENSTTWGDVQTQNLVIADINKKILIESSSAIPVETCKDIPMEFENIPAENDTSENQSSDFMKTTESLSSEIDTLRTQNLSVIKSHRAVSTQPKSLEMQNLELAQSLEQIHVERDTFEAQNLILSASLRQACSERDDLESKLRTLEEEVRLLLEERDERIQVFLEGVDSLASVKECLKRIGHQINEGRRDHSVEAEEQVKLSADKEYKQLLLEVEDVYKLATDLESMITEQDEAVKKRMKVLSEGFDSFRAVKECLLRIAGIVREDMVANSVIDDEQVKNDMGVGEVPMNVLSEIAEIYELAVAAESRIMAGNEMRRIEIEKQEEETRRRDQFFSNNCISLQTVKECLGRIVERVTHETSNLTEEDERIQSEQLDLVEDSERVSSEITYIHKLASLVEAQILENEESRQKEMKDLEDRSRRIGVLFDSFDSLQSVKGCLTRIVERFRVNVERTIGEDGQVPRELDLDEVSESMFLEIRGICKLAMAAEAQIMEHDGMRKKEIRELENSVVSLTEENRDINSLLKIALAEKEAVEKSLSRLKGSGEHRRLPIMQIVQKVGLTFMMGGSSSTSTADQSEGSSANSGTRSDSSECEEEVVSLASTVEKIMKNLRLEISQLRRSLEESRSDGESLQSLTEKQAQKIEECTFYIKDLEQREMMLTQNVEELMTELAEAGEEIVRWREACELEVEAAKVAVEERDKQAAILKEELEKTEASLEETEKKLKVKEELAAAAMAAQAAAEKALQLVDSRSVAFRERIEELSRQLEEAESKRERADRRKVRHVCWPWPSLRISPAAARRQEVGRRRRPEMEALLHHHSN